VWELGIAESQSAACEKYRDEIVIRADESKPLATRPAEIPYQFFFSSKKCLISLKKVHNPFHIQEEVILCMEKGEYMDFQGLISLLS